jgi:C4-dicarboxylate-specific signal transduction histidine kinase
MLRELKILFKSIDEGFDTVFVQGNKSRLVQVIVNLLSNAIKLYIARPEEYRKVDRYNSIEKY